MSSPRLKTYLILEQQALALDEIDENLANTIRDVMDPIWYQLTDAEHELLNLRIIEGLAGSSISVNSDLFLDIPRPPNIVDRESPVEVVDWECEVA